MKCLLVSVLLVSMTVTAQKTIVVIGSSTSSGYGLPIPGGVDQDQTDNLQNLLPDSSWVNRMRTYSPLYNVVDLAIFGEDCYQGMPVGTNIANRPGPDGNNNITKALGFNPDIVVVNFPSNNYDIYSVTEVMRCFRTIYTTAISNGHTTCYITTTQPRDVFSASDRAKLKTIRDSVILELGLHALDFFTPVATGNNINPSLGQGDGVHLNSAGHKLLWLQALAGGVIPVVTPITLQSFSASVRKDDVTFNWVTGVESGMRDFQLTHLTPSGWETVATIQARNTPSSYSFTLAGTTMAGSIAILLLGGLSFKKRNTLWLLGLVILLVACRKQLQVPTATNDISGQYRLVITDNDGNLSYSQIVRI